MKHIIKKTFIPHKKTNPRPLFWHPFSISFFFLTLLFIFGFLSLQKLENIDSHSLLGDVRSGLLVMFTNNERSELGLTSLIESETLNQAAVLKAQNMSQEGYFSHYSPTGVSPWFWFNEVGYEYQKAGENLAVNFDDSKKIVNAWMNSPTHKANILNSGYSEIGIGTAEGIYKGKKATFVVQLFAKPKTIAETNNFVLAIERKIPLNLNEQSSIQGAEIEMFSSANIIQVFTSEKYAPIIIMVVFSLIIIFAILTVFVKRKHYNKIFFISLFVLIFVLVLSIYTLINFFRENSVHFLQ